MPCFPFARETHPPLTGFREQRPARRLEGCAGAVMDEPGRPMRDVSLLNLPSRE